MVENNKTLENTRLVYPVKQIPVEDMLLVYQYDETSESGLSWRYDIEFEMIPGYIRSRKGSRVGTLNKLNRWQLHFNGKIYAIHRVIWTMFNGPIPEGYCINHINCNPSDNRINNLELATSQQNSRKTKMHVKGEVSKLNTSGVNGVYEERTWNGARTKMNFYARAYWHDINGKAMRKSFAYSKYGKEEAWRLAELHVVEERNKVDKAVDERDKYEKTNCK